MTITIQVNNLSKKFKDVPALDNCSFEISKGEIFGYLGPSGAGKTTTIKLLTGQLKSDGGTIEVFGESPFSNEIKQRFGIMSDNSGLYEKLTVYDNLALFADIYGVSHDAIDKILEEIELLDDKKKLVSKLSKGMRQRLIFARTILHSPEILFLDEPTANLDPSTAEDVRNLIRKLNKNGTTVFLTTHNMQEAEEMCDRVAFLNNGKIIESGTPDQLKLKYKKNKVVITFANGAKEVSLDGKAISEALQDGDEILMIHSVEPTLKDVFLGLTEGEWNHEV